MTQKITATTPNWSPSRGEENKMNDDDLACPYCGHVHPDGGLNHFMEYSENTESSFQCQKCGETSIASMIVTFTYSTRKRV